MNLQEYCVFYPSFLAGEILHRMCIPKTEMDIFIHSFHSISILAPFVAARRGNFNFFLSEFCHRVEAPMRTNKREISAVGEMIQQRNALKWISASHSLEPLN